MSELPSYAHRIPPDFKTISKLVIECNGKIRFTKPAIKIIGGIFGYHGIDIRQIHTVAHYNAACNQIIETIISILPEPDSQKFADKNLEEIIAEIVASDINQNGDIA